MLAVDGRGFKMQGYENGWYMGGCLFDNVTKAAKANPTVHFAEVDADGSVTLKPRPGETGWKRFDAYLFTERKYRSFVLDLEFKIEPTGNSGVFFCVADPLDPVDKGIELQILDTHGLATPGNHDCGGIIRAMAGSVTFT